MKSHQIDYFLDYCCPYSAKFFKTLYFEVIPWAKELVEFRFHHQIQPWHPQSTLLHEAALAVKKIDSSSFEAYSKILFENQKDYFDKNTFELTRTEIYVKLVELAKPLGIDPKEMMELLRYSTKPGDHLNEGNLVTNDLKRE
jgi:hypothetical protein